MASGIDWVIIIGRPINGREVLKIRWLMVCHFKPEQDNLFATGTGMSIKTGTI